MPKFDIVTIGGAVRDITFYTNKGKIFSTPEDLTAQKMLAFEYGAKINVPEAYCSVGGGAANSAVSLARLGFKAATIVRIGKDEDGNHILNKFKKEKINTNFIQLDYKTLTGFSFILSLQKEKEHIAFSYRGANENLAIQSGKLEKIITPWLYLASLSGISWLKTLRSTFNFARKKNVKKNCLKKIPADIVLPIDIF